MAENYNTTNPLVAVKELRRACYDMIYASENGLLNEIIDKSSDEGYPFNSSLDEALNEIADWCDNLTNDYKSATERRG